MFSCMDYDCGAVSDMGYSNSVLGGQPSPVCELGEDSSSLNHPLSHSPVHLSYNILREDHQL